MKKHLIEVVPQHILSFTDTKFTPNQFAAAKQTQNLTAFRFQLNNWQKKKKI